MVKGRSGSIVSSNQPTAQTSSGATAATEWSEVRVLGVGLVIWLQLLPSQCMMSVRNWPPSAPTAHTSFVLIAVIPYRLLLSSSGVGTSVHSLPSQCIALVYHPSFPTAQTSSEAIPATAWRNCPPGLGTWAQTVPSQCIVNGWAGAPVVKPTAQMSLGEIAAIPRRLPASSVGTTVQLAPSQCSINIFVGFGPDSPTTQISVSLRTAIPYSGLE